MSKNAKEIPEPEWSHNVAAEQVGDSPLELTIAPGEAERTRLIRRLNLLALDDCEATLRLKRQAGHVIHVTGEITAKVRQSCVVTLEPVLTDVQENFEAWYADPEQAISLAKAKQDRRVQKGQTEMPILDEKEDPEHMVDGKIDLGELVTQYLSLGIDPYPHAPGVERTDMQEDLRPVHEEGPVIKSPFAVLKDWKDKLK